MDDPSPILRPADLARLIDHTILRPEATAADVARVCEEALRHRFAAVCVNPVFVPQVTAALAGSGVAVCSVVNFPFGAAPSEAKAAETALAVAQGAAEIDMVIHVGALKAGAVAAVRSDIAAVRAACGPALLKVIIEASLLTDAEKVTACEAAVAAGAAYVKTSTGYGGGGATVEDVALMRRVVGAGIGVKASGGVRTLAQARALVAAGATRIGASGSVALVSDPAP